MILVSSALFLYKLPIHDGGPRGTRVLIAQVSRKFSLRISRPTSIVRQFSRCIKLQDKHFFIFSPPKKLWIRIRIPHSHINRMQI